MEAIKKLEKYGKVTFGEISSNIIESSGTQSKNFVCSYSNETYHSKQR